jgi:hypothetical protein
MNMKEIKILIDKYLDGATSNDEERQLREFFLRTDIIIPPEWRVYKALFAYEKDEAEAIAETPLTPALKPTTKRKDHHLWIEIISAVACLLLIASIFLNIRGGKKNYAVINGVVTTNKETVNREAEAALNIVSSNDDETFGALENMQK